MFPSHRNQSAVLLANQLTGFYVMRTLVAKGLSTSHQYVMLESFTTDSLENPFEKLRQV